MTFFSSSHQPPPLMLPFPLKMQSSKPLISMCVRRSVVSDSLLPMDCSSPGSSVLGILQARILEWEAIPFSRGIFPTQGSNLGLPHCRQILYHLSHQRSPNTPLAVSLARSKLPSKLGLCCFLCLGDQNGRGDCKCLLSIETI